MCVTGCFSDGSVMLWGVGFVVFCFLSFFKYHSKIRWLWYSPIIVLNSAVRPLLTSWEAITFSDCTTANWMNGEQNWWKLSYWRRITFQQLSENPIQSCRAERCQCLKVVCKYGGFADGLSSAVGCLVCKKPNYAFSCSSFWVICIKGIEI